MVLATDRADVNRTVRKHLDVRKISFASMDEAVSRTGMEYGGITPIGLPRGGRSWSTRRPLGRVGRHRQRLPGEQDPAARTGAGLAPRRRGSSPLTQAGSPGG
jgi:hypothetical protein